MNIYFNTSKYIRYVYPKQLFWEIPTHEQKVYLTFDDGPTPGITDELLGILKTYQAKATFFCLGKNVAQNQGLFSKILEAGHTVGNHTWDHRNGKNTALAEYLDSIHKTADLFGSNLFRPPYGKITYKQAKLISKDYRIVMWSVLSGDFDNRTSKDQCLKVALKNTKPGSVIVFHDSTKAAEKMLTVVPKFIESFQNKGFEFSAIHEDSFG